MNDKIGYLRRTQRKALLQLAWPAVLEMFLHTSVWTLDTVMVGRLGAAALGAVSLGGQFYWTILFIVASLGTGTMILVSRRVGAGDHEDALRIGGMALTLMTFTSVAVALGVFLLAPGLFKVAGTEPDVAAQGTAYMRIVSIGAVFVLPAMAGTAILRGWGDTRTPLYIVGASNATNLLLDYVLIFGHLGFPAMGVPGAAIASLAAHFLAFILVGWYLFFRWKTPGLSLSHLRNPKPAVARSLVSLSIPTGLEWFLLDGSRAVQSLIIASLGTHALAAHQVAVVAESLSFMPGWGIAVATTILVGQNLGAGEPEAASESARQGTLLAVVSMGAFAVCFLLFPRSLASVFTSDPTVISLSAACLMVAAFSQPFIAVAENMAGTLRGAGDTKPPLYISALTSWGIRLPLTVVFVKVLALPIPYVWAGTAVEWMARAVLLLWFFRRGAWKRTVI
ncbi:MAG: MATE family efflux transporter [Bacillota bacterium]